MADLRQRLSEAMRQAMLGYDPCRRERWIHEYLVPSLEAKGLTVVDAQLERTAVDAWRMKCQVDAEQVEAAGITVAVFERWCDETKSIVGRQILKHLERARRFHGPSWVPGAKWWAHQINRETETPADAQQMFDEIVTIGRPSSDPRGS